jgi:hypothetical protein
MSPVVENGNLLKVKALVDALGVDEDEVTPATYKATWARVDRLPGHRVPPGKTFGIKIEASSPGNILTNTEYVKKASERRQLTG